MLSGRDDPDAGGGFSQGQRPQAEGTSGNRQGTAETGGSLDAGQGGSDPPGYGADDDLPF
jgi:hypothetical protein